MQDIAALERVDDIAGHDAEEQVFQRRKFRYRLRLTRRIDAGLHIGQVAREYHRGEQQALQV